MPSASPEQLLEIIADLRSELITVDRQRDSAERRLEALEIHCRNHGLYVPHGLPGHDYGRPGSDLTATDRAPARSPYRPSLPAGNDERRASAAERILADLREHPWSSAPEVARRMQITPGYVYAMLAELAGRVRRHDSHPIRYALADEPSIPRRTGHRLPLATPDLLIEWLQAEPWQTSTHLATRTATSQAGVTELVRSIPGIQIHHGPRRCTRYALADAGEIPDRYATAIERIERVIHRRPGIAFVELAAAVEVSESTVRAILKQLADTDHIEIRSTKRRGDGCRILVYHPKAPR